jgi:2-polyprenyl-6-methoxyphenol hydroxylase-like FAD-dependent oxidoreductase
MTKTVLIVGAGPVGLTAATELARYGIAVRIVDKSAQRTDKSKAVVLWSRTLELLDRGSGSASFRDAGFKVHAVNVVADDGSIMGHVTMDTVDSPYPYALMLPQSDTERLLEDRLRGFGVEVERSVEVMRLTAADDGVLAVLRHADGTEESVKADWLLGCDGAHSIVRSTLGVEFAGETMMSDWMLADIHMRGYPFPDTEASVYWHHNGVFVVFPLAPGRHRVIANLPMTADERSPDPTLEEVQAIIDERGPAGMVAFDPVWLAGFRINGRKVSNYRAGRMFLLGDAAHIHSPAGGQGMNTGMQDAFNLSWKLALVMNGICGDVLLDSYSPERSKVGDEVLKDAGRITTVGTMRNPVAQSVRDFVAHFMLGLPAFQEKFADVMTEVSIGYPDSPLNGAARSGGRSPGPGKRVRPLTGLSPVGAGSTPRFALFAEPSEAVDGLLKHFPSLLDPALRPAFVKDGMTLVRPDGYAACSAVDASDITNYLERLC